MLVTLHRRSTVEPECRTPLEAGPSVAAATTAGAVIAAAAAVNANQDRHLNSHSQTLQHRYQHQHCPISRSSEMPNTPTGRLPPSLSAAMASEQARPSRLTGSPEARRKRVITPLAQEAFNRTPAAVVNDPRVVSEAMERMRARVAAGDSRAGGGGPARHSTAVAPPTGALQRGPPPPSGRGPRNAAARKSLPPERPRPPPKKFGPPAHRPSFDRRALFAMTKFRPRPIDEEAPAPVVGPDGYQGGFESDANTAAGGGRRGGGRSVRRHSWSSARDFSDCTPGSDIFDKFGWASGESSSEAEAENVTAAAAGAIVHASGGSGDDSSGARAVVTETEALATTIRRVPPHGQGGQHLGGGQDPRVVIDRAKFLRRHSSESFFGRSSSGDNDYRSSGRTSARFAPSPMQQERTVREKRREVLAMSQRFKTDRINELQDENKDLKTLNETLEARVAEAQEKAVDFVVKVLQSKGLLEMGELKGIMEAGVGNSSENNNASAFPAEKHQPGKPDVGPGEVPPSGGADDGKRSRRKSIETVSSSVASMIWKSGMISRDSRFSSGPDCSDVDTSCGAPGKPGSRGVRKLRERCRLLRAERNHHHEEAQRAQREVKVLTAEVEGLQRELIEALDGAELAERRKARMDEMEHQLEGFREELRIKQIELEAKSEELELAEEDLKAIKDEMAEGDGKFGSGKSSLLTGIDVPSYGTPSMCRTETSRSNDISGFSADDESVKADALRQMEEMIHQRDVALLAARGDLRKGADRTARLEDELDRARQEVVAARAAAGIYRAEMENEIERADTEARALLRDARREVRHLGELLDESEATVRRLELELETAREDVEDLKEELKIERAITGNGSLGYPLSEDELSAKFGGAAVGKSMGPDDMPAAGLKFVGGSQEEDDLLSVLVKVQIENHQLRERLGMVDD